MPDTRFDEFVRREQHAFQTLDQNPIDWQAEKAEWLRYLDELFARINDYLRPYVDKRQIEIAYRPIQLNEEFIGPYSAREMLITIGSKVVKLEPIGTVIVGSKGRVDVVGPLSRAQLYLISRDIKTASQMFSVTVRMNGRQLVPSKSEGPSKVDWTWKIISRPPKQAFIEIDKENFLDLLLEVANG